ncbi:MAG: rod shape-determining protein MreC [Melioribacteraceae bacterium]|nr:rod shape-determining protein MreC [Melioribacteraceae bacterium]
MLKSILRYIANYKNYFVYLSIAIISIFLIKFNDHPKLRQVKILGLTNFAIVNYSLDQVINFFKSDKEINALKYQNAKLMMQVNLLRQNGFENKKLKDLLNLTDTSKFDLIPVNIVSKLVSRTQGTYLLNKGSNDSIKSGMPVIDEKGLVGIISEVTSEFSVVKTLKNSTLSIAVTIQRTNVDGIMDWDGKELIIKNIPTTYDVLPGDQIETSDFSTLFPPAVPVGIVLEKKANALGLLHNISVKSSADIDGAENLFIVRYLSNIQAMQIKNKLKRSNN